MYCFKPSKLDCSHRMRSLQEGWLLRLEVSTLPTPFRKLVGVTTLDVVRSRAFLAEKCGLDVSKVNIPVVGGHAGETIMPILSQTSPEISLSPEDAEVMDKRIQNAGTEVVNAKNGAGSATLSMAFAAAEFCKVVVAGLNGGSAKGCCYVGNREGEVAYLACECEFGTNGVETVLPICGLSNYEEDRFTAVKKKLAGDIQAGIDFVANL